MLLPKRYVHPLGAAWGEVRRGTAPKAKQLVKRCWEQDPRQHVCAMVHTIQGGNLHCKWLRSKEQPSSKLSLATKGGGKGQGQRS